MTVFEAPSWWRGQRLAQVRAGLTLGFVPTMGALHEGHLSLVRRSRAENDLTLVSIFVNPAQFDDLADLENYPQPLETDLATLETEGADFVFRPREPDLYADDYRYRVTEIELSTVMEGAHRPGHFDGVLTVVLQASADHLSRASILRREGLAAADARPRDGRGVFPLDDDCRVCNGPRD